MHRTSTRRLERHNLGCEGQKKNLLQWRGIKRLRKRDPHRNLRFPSRTCISGFLNPLFSELRICLRNSQSSSSTFLPAAPSTYPMDRPIPIELRPICLPPVSSSNLLPPIVPNSHPKVPFHKTPRRRYETLAHASPKRTPCTTCSREHLYSGPQWHS
jgi:hypothetical protein